MIDPEHYDCTENKPMGESKRRAEAGHDPIEAALSQKMNHLAGALDDIFNKGDPAKEIAFVLLTARKGMIKDGRVNYISNGNRHDIMNVMRELLGRFEGKTTIPASNTYMEQVDGIYKETRPNDKLLNNPWVPPVIYAAEMRHMTPEDCASMLMKMYDAQIEALMVITGTQD